MLGEAGAIVYCTGRSVRGKPRREGGSAFDLENRPETIQETAEMVNAHGGVGIPVQVDHTVEDQVKALLERIRAEQGKLDVLVNDVWGGDELTEWGKPFWEHSLQKGLLMQQRAVGSHIITSRYAAPLMIERGQGLIIEITDGDTLAYRGNLFYDLAKTSVIRLAYGMAEELRPYNITALALTPGFLRSEAMLDHFGVAEANWQEGVRKDPHFIASETPFYVGRAVAALAADPNVWEKSGKTFSSWNLAEEYGFKDIDGRQPHWGRHFKEHIANKS
jgi:NAD(P)-dependent dehydrogenase (short-subunit alcohol dehydrogenase family)